jgi:hypothetical protein
VGAICAVLLWTSTAHADGIDIAWFLTRVGGWKHNPVRASLLVLALAAINYLLNWVVIGLPAIRAGVPVRRVSRDLVGLTIIGQVMDRVGMVASALVGSVGVGALFTVLHVSVRDVGPLILGTVIVNFLSSGILIGFLVRHYVCRRWEQPRRSGRLIGIAAAVLTNPAWAIATAFVPAFYVK